MFSFRLIFTVVLLALAFSVELDSKKLSHHSEYSQMRDSSLGRAGRVRREEPTTPAPTGEPTPAPAPGVPITQAPGGTPGEPAPTPGGSTGSGPSTGPAAAPDDDTDISPDPGPDPFPTSVKWAHFVKVVEAVTAGATTILKGLVDHWTSAYATFSTDKEKSANFSGDFTEQFRTFSEFLEPLHDHLVDSAPYTKINPAIGLTTIIALNELAKSNPTKIKDKTRVKWIEINAMAITAHHVFDRMYDLMSGHGLFQINGALAIGYPSWLSKNALNDTAEIYEEKTARELVGHIHEEMTSLGDTDHLVRGLERILRRKLISIDPSTTDYNFYCYGNNEYGLIHDVFDLVTDATLFLVAADIKYSGLELSLAVSKAIDVITSTGGPTPVPDVAKDLEAILKNMTERIDRKVKFSSSLATVSDEAIIPGPTTFKCDRPPKPADPTKGPILTSDAFPPGVYIQNNTAYNPDGTALSSDSDGIPLLPNGTKLAAEMRPMWQGPDGLPLHGAFTPNDKGEPIDPDGNPVPATKVMVLIPIDSKTPKLTNPDYPMTEWGITLPTVGITPRANGLEPPLDPQTGPNSTGGYLDDRKPDLLAAQFSKAFSGYIEAEQVLSPDGACAGTCRDYKFPTSTCNNKTEHCNSFRRAVCEPGKNCLEKSNCPSRARRCVRTGREVNFCPSAGNSSLYDWIKVNGKVIGSRDGGDNSTGGTGSDGSCSTEAQTAKERWEMEFGIILNAPQYCEVCLCVCDDPLVPDGINYFNTEELVSRIAEGFVITSIKFERLEEDKTMRLSIEEGKMIGDGIIDLATPVWVTKTLDKGKNVLLGGSGFKKINLDVVYGLSSEVVTGVRFVRKDGADALSLEVQFTKINAQGALESTPGEWRGANYPQPISSRRVYDLSDTENPTNQKGPSQPFHVPDNSRSVEFDASSLEKDGGNSVIPFFDLQPVRHYSVHKALASVGILYKSKRGSGGFLTPAVSVYRKQFQASGTPGAGPPPPPPTTPAT